MIKSIAKINNSKNRSKYIWNLALKERDLIPKVPSLLAPFRAWYVDGRVLVVVVTFGIILPLCLLKNLGKGRSCLFYSLCSARMKQKPDKNELFFKKSFKKMTALCCHL